MIIIIGLLGFALIAMLLACAVVAGEADKREEERMRKAFKELEEKENEDD